MPARHRNCSHTPCKIFWLRALHIRHHEQTLNHRYLITFILKIGNTSDTCVYIYICLANVFYLCATAFQKQIFKVWLELFFIDVSRLLFYFESIFRIPVSVLNWRKSSIMDDSSEKSIEQMKTEKKSKLLGIFFPFSNRF